MKHPSCVQRKTRDSDNKTTTVSHRKVDIFTEYLYCRQLLQTITFPFESGESHQRRLRSRFAEKFKAVLSYTITS